MDGAKRMGQLAADNYLPEIMVNSYLTQIHERGTRGTSPIPHLSYDERNGTFRFRNGKAVPDHIASRLQLEYDRNLLSSTEGSVLGVLPTVRTARQRIIRA